VCSLVCRNMCTHVCVGVSCRPFCSLYNSLKLEVVMASTTKDAQPQFVMSDAAGVQGGCQPAWKLRRQHQHCGPLGIQL
jgi:hypothetical protein